ncbi:hypothetical protein DRO69_00360 [Candidatus Bathyarchaeota archaeon]|nr:MAG: hypothetical protein DRO69_00360 [Candidatus Bathyarchaeota archaeon]
MVWSFSFLVQFWVLLSQRNCLIAFIIEGRINFWTAMEIVGGLTTLVGILILLTGFVKKT